MNNLTDPYNRRDTPLYDDNPSRPRDATGGPSDIPVARTSPGSNSTTPTIRSVFTTTSTTLGTSYKDRYAPRNAKDDITISSNHDMVMNGIFVAYNAARKAIPFVGRSETVVEQEAVGLSLLWNLSKEYLYNPIDVNIKGLRANNFILSNLDKISPAVPAVISLVAANGQRLNRTLPSQFNIQPRFDRFLSNINKQVPNAFKQSWDAFKGLVSVNPSSNYYSSDKRYGASRLNNLESDTNIDIYDSPLVAGMYYQHDIILNSTSNIIEQGKIFPTKPQRFRPKYPAGNSLYLPAVRYEDVPYGELGNGELPASGKLKETKMLDTKFDGINNLGVYTGESLIDTSSDISYDDVDLIPLKFYSVRDNKTVQFRSTLSRISQNTNASWASNKFVGSPFNHYIYSQVERTISVTFTVYASNGDEFKKAWEKYNFLTTLLYPSYTPFRTDGGAAIARTYHVPPIIKVTIGDLFKSRYAIIESITTSAESTTPWEIEPGMRLPQVFDVDVSMKLLEDRNTTLVGNMKLYDYDLNTNLSENEAIQR